MRIFFSAGEPSGDLHAANLIRQLKARCPGLEAVGYGGPQMASAGCDLHADLTELAVMWILHALANLHKFWDLASRADRYFRRDRPDAVVLVDYPGFNWWIARRAKAHGIPVFYYTPPQIWAWADWRVKKMRRLVDHVLCSLPFEESWFRERGCNATFVGHPFFDEVRRCQPNEAFMTEMRSRPGPLVTILPGSRTQEVIRNLPWFLAAAGHVARAVPQARFAVASFKPHQADIARQMIANAAGKMGTGTFCAKHPKGRSGKRYLSPFAGHLPAIEVLCGRTPELMQLADCTMACSGSVSLELLYHLKPTVILYHVGRFGFFVQKFFRKVKYITLVNLLATDELYPADLTPFDPRQPDAARIPFPEYLTCEDRSEQIAAHVTEWLTDPTRRAERVALLEALRARVGHGGASSRGAEYILAALAVHRGRLTC